MIAEMINFAIHINGLAFSQKPDYSFLRRCLQGIIVCDDLLLDWNAP